MEYNIDATFKAKKISGDPLFEIDTEEQSAKLLKIRTQGKHQVSVTVHQTLTTVLEVISEDDLLDCTEEDILEGLRKHAVTAVKGIVLRRDSQEQPTKHLILAFELHTLLPTVKTCYLKELCNEFNVEIIGIFY